MQFNLFNTVAVLAETQNQNAESLSETGFPLGIDIVQIAFYMVCFVIAMVVLQKYLFIPLVKILDQREAKLAASLDLVDELELKIAEADNKAKSIIAQAHANGRQILEDAKSEVEPLKSQYLREAEEQKMQIIANAKREAHKIISTATANAENEVLALAQKTIQKATANLAISGAAQNEILGSIINLKI